MKVVLDSEADREFVAELRNSFPSVNFCQAPTKADQVREIPDAEVLFGAITPAVFEAAGKLRWCHFVGAGFDKLVRGNPAFVASDVVLTNAPGTHAMAMADHVMGIILMFAHRMVDMLDDQRAHRWDVDKYRAQIRELEGTTMGLLAVGSIGRAVAVRAQAFGIRVCGVDLKPMKPPEGVAEVWTLEGLERLLRISDWFVVTAPLTDGTEGLLNRDRIGQLKQGSHLIVISRGGIVDETAVVEGLRSGSIAGAGFDAVETEPLPDDSPLWDMPNVLISPHVSGDSPQTWERRYRIFKDNLARYLRGDPLLHICDKRAGF